MVGGPAMVGRPGVQHKMAPRPLPGRLFLLAPWPAHHSRTTHHMVVGYITGYINVPLLDLLLNPVLRTPFICALPKLCCINENGNATGNVVALLRWQQARKPQGPGVPAAGE